MEHLHTTNKRSCMNVQKIARWIIVTALLFMGLAATLQFLIKLSGETLPLSFTDLCLWLIMCGVCLKAALTQRKAWAITGLLSIFLTLVKSVELSLFYVENHSISLVITLLVALHLSTMVIPQSTRGQRVIAH